MGTRTVGRAHVGFLAPRRYASPHCVLGRRQSSRTTVYAPVGSSLGPCDARISAGTSVASKPKSDRNVQTLGEQAFWWIFPIVGLAVCVVFVIAMVRAMSGGRGFMCMGDHRRHAGDDDDLRREIRELREEIKQLKNTR